MLSFVFTFNADELNKLNFHFCSELLVNVGTDAKSLVLWGALKTFGVFSFWRHHRQSVCRAEVVPSWNIDPLSTLPVGVLIDRQMSAGAPQLRQLRSWNKTENRTGSPGS